MRILLINKFLYPKGGTETYLFALGGYLQAQGHQVQYFGMEHEKRTVGNRINVYTSRMDFHGDSRQKKLPRPLKTIYSVEARRKLRQVLEDFQPEVCHLNNFNYQLTPSIIPEIQKWKRQSGRSCKLICTAHDYQLACPNHMCYNPNTQTNCQKCLGGRYWHCIAGKCIHGSLPRSILGAAEGFFWRQRKIYRQLDRILCCSRFVKETLDADPILAEKTVVLENFVSVGACSGRAPGGYVLYFGRFSREKGILTLLEACKRLPDIPFIFAGAGPLEAELQGVSNVKNVGFRRGEELDKLIEEANFTVCPSLWNEPYGLAAAEALAKGVPVVGADIGGISGLICPGTTGALFPAGDADALTETVRALWQDPAEVCRLRENCRNAAVRTVDVYYRELMEYYRM